MRGEGYFFEVTSAGLYTCLVANLRKNEQLISELYRFIKRRFSYEEGDWFRIEFEFHDYHGYDMRNLVVKKYSCVKVDYKTKLDWKDAAIVDNNQTEAKL